MTEVEVREHKESLNRRRNFWTAVGFVGLMGSLFGAPMIIPALKYPGIALSNYYMARQEGEKHGKDWKKWWGKKVHIFSAKSHHDEHGGHDDSHGGGHGGH